MKHKLSAAEVDETSSHSSSRMHWSLSTYLWIYILKSWSLDWEKTNPVLVLKYEKIEYIDQQTVMKQAPALSPLVCVLISFSSQARLCVYRRQNGKHTLPHAPPYRL